MKNQCQNFFSGIKEETRVFDISAGQDQFVSVGNFNTSINPLKL